MVQAFCHLAVSSLGAAVELRKHASGCCTRLTLYISMVIPTGASCPPPRPATCSDAFEDFPVAAPFSDFISL